MSAGVLHVVFRVGTAEYVLPATIVTELDAFTGATEVPGVVDYVVGLVHVRGRVIPLVDLRRRFGMPALEHAPDRRVVVVEYADRRIGLLVDSAREVVRIDPAGFVPPPPLVVERTAGFVEAVVQLGSRLLMLLACDRVLEPESRDERPAAT